MDGNLTAYETALEYLFARTTGSFRFGLERTYALLDAIGNPHTSYPSLHIAGTNGKGSSVATATAFLRAKGLRVGRYTSPHLVDFRERMVVDDTPISSQEIVDFISEHTPLVEKLGATFFEATTALALQHFASADVDVAIIEAGLGGRLDSTNVIVPRAAGVTSIGFDHMEYLGTTLEAIAEEKAGIFKRGIPAVIGEPDAAIRTLLATSARVKAASPVVTVGDTIHVEDVIVSSLGTDFTLRTPDAVERIRTPLIGMHQAANFAFAYELVNAAGDGFAVSLADAARAAKDIVLPGRFQRHDQWIFDVAHNADGARTLAGSVAGLSVERPLAALVCVLGDKEWKAMIDELATVVDEFVLTNAPTAPVSRAWSLDGASAYAREQGYSVTAIADFESAIETVQARAKTVLVTGSFHTVGDAMKVLQVSPLTG